VLSTRAMRGACTQLTTEATKGRWKLAVKKNTRSDFPGCATAAMIGVVAVSFFMEVRGAVAKDGRVFRDSENGFVVHIPEGWRQIDATMPGTKLKITDVDSGGFSDCGINVRRVPRAPESSNGLAISSAPSADEMQASYRIAIPDAAVTDRRATWLSNRPAVLYRVTFTARSLDTEVEFVMLQVQTAIGNRGIAVSCRMPVVLEEKTMPKVREFIAGVVLLPEP